MVQTWQTNQYLEKMMKETPLTYMRMRQRESAKQSLPTETDRLIDLSNGSECDKDFLRELVSAIKADLHKELRQ